MAGEVVEVGQGVENFKDGDKVVAMLNFIVSFKSINSYVFLLIYILSIKPQFVFDVILHILTEWRWIG